MKLTIGNFYIYINLGGLFATIITPFLRNSNGGESYTLVFAVGVSTFFIASGNLQFYNFLHKVQINQSTFFVILQLYWQWLVLCLLFPTPPGMF